MAALTRAGLLAHLQFRRVILADAAECMFAALQLHVEGCPLCSTQTCNDATHATVRAIREALRLDWTARRAELDLQQGGAGDDARSEPGVLFLPERPTKQ
jgi:hypothetical protein